MTNIILHGIHGRMGHMLQAVIAQRDDCAIVAGIDPAAQPCTVPVFSSLAQCDVGADVLIDFSGANVIDALLDACVIKKMPCVLCTTGLTDATLAHVQKAAQKIAIFQSANMSLGVNVLIALAKKANAIFGTSYEIEIIEKHHHNKLDAPSGTAMMLADAICDASPAAYEYVYDRHTQRKQRNPLEIGLHAVRGGSIVGEHEVLFCGANEVITLSHSAASREVFATGAVNAALFLAEKPAGLYTMEDLVGV